MKKFRVHYPKDSILKSRRIVDISSWEVLNHEWIGTRDKVILKHPETGKWYLVKFPKYGENEIYYELFNCYLGKSLGLKYADYFLCRYKNNLCIASKSFLDVGEKSSELWEMKELICRYASNIDGIELMYGRNSEVLREHNIENIVQILKAEFGESVFPGFFKMIGFDCLTGHGDRHWENYGVLLLIDENENDLSFKFAPIYDTAYGYLLERSDEKIKSFMDDGTLDDPSWYDPDIKGLCKITIEGNIRASHIDLFKFILCNEDISKYSKYLLEIINKYDIEIVKNILKNEPFRSGLTNVRKDVIIKVIEMRYGILKSLLEENSERISK